MSTSRFRKSSACAALLSAAAGSAVSAGVYSAPGGPLVDKPATAFGEASFPLVIAGTGETVTSVNSLTWTGLSHSWVGDLNVVLIAPNGAIATLYGPPDNDSSNLDGDYVMVVDPLVPTIDEASVPLGDGDVIPSGTYAISDYLNANDPGPRSSFDALLGSPVDGTWTLRFRDYGPGDTGALGSWSLSVNAAAVPGDADGDGDADLDDIGIWATNFTGSLAPGAGTGTLGLGDFDGDKDVDLDDQGIWAANFTGSLAPAGVVAGAAAAVPEPSALSVLALAGIAAASRRRRRYLR